MRALWKRLCGGYVKSSLHVCGYEARAISKNLLCSCELHMAAALQLAPITWVRSKSTSQNPLDTPSWRVNMTQGSSSCDELRKWCGPCCLQKAAHAGRGVAALRRRLAQPQATLHVSVVGNSVARFNNFGVARGFVHELRRRFPATKVTIEYAHVAGGFEPDHLYYCGLSSRSLLRADLVLIHYHAPRGGLVYEKVLRRLLALPRRPVVAYVAHCTMSDFSYHRDWVVARDRGPWGWRMGDEAQGYFEQLRAVEHRLVSTHYGLPFASTCAAFHSMLGAVDQSDRLVDTSFEPTVHGWLTRMGRRYLPESLARSLDPTRRTDVLGTWGIGDPSQLATSQLATSQLATARPWAGAGGVPSCQDGAQLAHVTDLQRPFFPQGDHLHLGPKGSALQACLLTHTLLDAPLTTYEAAAAAQAAADPARSTQGRTLPEPSPEPLPEPLLGPAEANLFCGTGAGRGGFCTDTSSDEPTFCLSAVPSAAEALSGGDGEGAGEGAGKGPGAVGKLPSWVRRADGWSWARHGGANGSKAFMHTTTPGARMHVRTPRPARAFLLQVYQHHERPLGRLRVEVPGMRELGRHAVGAVAGGAVAGVQLLDPCCAHPGCPGKPIGKGGYTMMRVPASGFLPRPTTDLTLTGLAPEGPSECARLGAELSMAGMVGLAAPGDPPNTLGEPAGDKGASGVLKRVRARNGGARRRSGRSASHTHTADL